MVVGVSPDSSTIATSPDSTTRNLKSRSPAAMSLLPARYRTSDAAAQRPSGHLGLVECGEGDGVQLVLGHVSTSNPKSATSNSESAFTHGASALASRRPAAIATSLPGNVLPSRTYTASSGSRSERAADAWERAPTPSVALLRRCGIRIMVDPAYEPGCRQWQSGSCDGNPLASTVMATLLLIDHLANGDGLPWPSFRLSSP
jgi:hypothetical protein